MFSQHVVKPSLDMNEHTMSCFAIALTLRALISRAVHILRRVVHDRPLCILHVHSYHVPTIANVIEIAHVYQSRPRTPLDHTIQPHLLLFTARNTQNPKGAILEWQDAFIKSLPHLVCRESHTW